MNIEIVNELKGVEVTEYTIRDVRDDDCDNSIVKTPNFQAFLISHTAKALGNIEFNISYYDEDDEFLGYDEGKRDFHVSKKNSVSIPLTLPERVSRVKCELISLEIWEHDFKSWLYRIAAVLVLLLLLQFVVGGFVELF